MIESLDTNIVLIILVIVSIVAIVVRRLKLPYTLALILTGLVLSMLHLSFTESLAEKFPELLLTLFLPALLFEGAMNINTDELFKNIKAISLLSIFGVACSVILTGVSIHYLLGLSWSISLIFGALISPTDPIAVINIFKQNGISKRLSTIIEAESLFNDGTGIVIFKIIVALITSGIFDFKYAVLEFVKLAFGGLVLGAIIGYVAAKIIKNIDDRMVQISITTIMAYGGYILAENLGLSGVIAVATEGILVGVYAARYISPSSRLSLISFWEYAGFILNSIVFLLIGIEIHINDLILNFWTILIAFIIVVLARVIYVTFLSWVINKVDDSRIINGVNEYIPRKWTPVIIWGGLHGGLAMVLALNVSSQVGIDKTLLLNLTFGVVFFSLMIQGISMGKLLEILNLKGMSKKVRDYQTMVANMVAISGAEKEIEKLYDSKIISKKTYLYLKKETLKARKKGEADMDMLLLKNQELDKEQLNDARKAILIAKKSSVMKGIREGLFSDEVGEKLIEDFDRKIFLDEM